MTTDYTGLKLDIDKMRDLLNQVSKNNEYMVVALFITDVMKNGSYIIYNDKASEILKDSFNLDQIYQGLYLDNVVSRKKQIIPAIMDVLERK